MRTRKKGRNQKLRGDAAQLSSMRILARRVREIQQEETDWQAVNREIDKVARDVAASVGLGVQESSELAEIRQDRDEWMREAQRLARRIEGIVRLVGDLERHPDVRCRDVYARVVDWARTATLRTGSIRREATR